MTPTRPEKVGANPTWPEPEVSWPDCIISEESGEGVDSKKMSEAICMSSRNVPSCSLGA